MKYILLALLCLGLLGSMGCKKETPDPVEEKEFFSFDANGKHYHYPQEKRPNYLSGGYTYTLGAVKPSGSLGFQISAHWLDGNVRRGEFEFQIGGSGIPDKDTLILYSVQIRKFFASNLNSYSITQPYTGRMIFTERNTSALRGIFELQAVKTTTDTLGYDSVLTITNGSFYIIP